MVGEMLVELDGERNAEPCCGYLGATAIDALDHVIPPRSLTCQKGVERTEI